MDALIEMQFFQIQRQDVTLSFVEPVSHRAVHELRTMPGVLYVEPFRSVPARLRHGHLYRNLALTGLPAEPTLNRVVSRSGQVARIPPEGLVLSEQLATVLGAQPGDAITIEVLVGSRPVRSARVAGLVDDLMGLSAYMEAGALHRLLREGESLSGAHLQIDSAALDDLYRRFKTTPAVAGVNLTTAALRSFQDTMAQNMWVMVIGNLVFAGIIAFGVVYNSARISLSERERELASLRVLGFTRAEISLVLLGELALLTLVALPVGVVLGYGLAQAIVSSIDSEVYRIPMVATPQAVAWSTLSILVATTISSLVVRRKLDGLDLVAVLKTRE
jgi:putative ABC transport system permease protein